MTTNDRNSIARPARAVKEQGRGRRPYSHRYALTEAGRARARTLPPTGADLTPVDPYGPEQRFAPAQAVQP